MASFWDRLLGRREVKDLELPIVSAWTDTAVPWGGLTWDRLKSEAYNVNAAVGACVAVHAFAYPEPHPLVKDKKGDPVGPEHPLQMLLDRPNPIMSHGELMEYISTYKAIGGNVYLHKVRNRAGVVIELWPYHDGHFTPIPSDNKWVASYEYDIGDGKKIRIPAADIIHLKWPSIDLDRPWMGLAPLRQIAREVDSDTEMTRMLYAFLANDATPRTLITFPKDSNLTPEQKEAMKQQFMVRHGRDQRGGVGFVTGGATISRMSLTMQELDLSALRAVPEARICAGFRVPPEVAGLTVGMAHSTENNLQSADVRFTSRTLVPLWKRDAGEYTRDLAAEFGPYTIEYDTSEVQALQEDQTAKVSRVVTVFEKNGMLLDELREAIGLPPIEDVIKGDERGTLFSYELKPTPPPQMPQPNIIDVTPPPEEQQDEPPPQLTDDAKARTVEVKARQQRRIDAIRERIQAAAAAKITADIEGALP